MTTVKSTLGCICVCPGYAPVNDDCPLHNIVRMCALVDALHGVALAQAEVNHAVTNDAEVSFEELVARKQRWAKAMVDLRRVDLKRAEEIMLTLNPLWKAS